MGLRQIKQELKKRISEGTAQAGNHTFIMCYLKIIYERKMEVREFCPFWFWSPINSTPSSQDRLLLCSQKAPRPSCWLLPSHTRLTTWPGNSSWAAPISSSLCYPSTYHSVKHKAEAPTYYFPFKVTWTHMGARNANLPSLSPRA